MGGASWTYDNSAFFPLDGQGFGDEENPHNFINGVLAIDFGGVFFVRRFRELARR